MFKDPADILYFRYPKFGPLFKDMVNILNLHILSLCLIFKDPANILIFQYFELLFYVESVVYISVQVASESVANDRVVRLNVQVAHSHTRYD